VQLFEQQHISIQNDVNIVVFFLFVVENVSFPERFEPDILAEIVLNETSYILDTHQLLDLPDFQQIVENVF